MFRECDPLKTDSFLVGKLFCAGVVWLKGFLHYGRWRFASVEMTGCRRNLDRQKRQTRPVDPRKSFWVALSRWVRM